MLECNLIKEHCPKYNTMLRDDKTYPYIRVTVGEDFPRVLFSRQQKKDKSRYFGPYTSAGAVKDTIELINKLYQLRTCNRVLPRYRQRAPVFKLPYPSVPGTLSGLYQQGRIPGKNRCCRRIFKWKLCTDLKILRRKMNEASENLNLKRQSNTGSF